jgi:GGDEF domain-containing protein
MGDELPGGWQHYQVEPNGPGEAVIGQGAPGHSPGDHPAWPELIAALDWLPQASLVLAPDGTALAVSQAWTVLSGVAAQDSQADGWLGAVEPLDRGVLRARLRDAAGARQAGYADFRLAGRPSRWWWRPGPARSLIVCVADLGDFRASHDWHQPSERRNARLIGRSEFVNLVGRALRRSGHHGEHVAVMTLLFDGIADAGDPDAEPASDLLRAAEERVSAAIGPAAAVQVAPGEFVILLDGLRAPGDAEIIASQVRHAVSQPLDVGGTPVPVTVVAALAIADGPGCSAEELIEKACRAARSGNRAGSPEPLDQPPAALRPGSARPLQVGLLVHRLLGVGLILRSAFSLADGLVAVPLQQAVDELDSIIRDTQIAFFGSLTTLDGHHGQPQ